MNGFGDDPQQAQSVDDELPDAEKQPFMIFLFGQVIRRPIPQSAVIPVQQFPNLLIRNGPTIVGYVSEVGLTWCKVSTLIETATSVGAYVERSGEIGVVKGDYTLKNQGYCQMSYLSAESDIKVGDRIVSSGIGVVYPRGLLIGTVAEIVPDEASRTLSARIEPAVDLKDISRVMIVKDFAGYTEESAETEK